MDSVAAFLRKNRIPSSFEDIYHELKPGLKEAWGHLVLPSGAGFISHETYQAALDHDRPEIQSRFNMAFSSRRAQALIMPTTPCPAPTIEQQTKFTLAGQEVDDLALARHTVAGSIAGLPGISVPMGMSSNGLPLGLEMDGRNGDDRNLLELARHVEAAIGLVARPI
ncbi:Mandelamide hydrolase [compost metagenome]